MSKSNSTFKKTFNHRHRINSSTKGNQKKEKLFSCLARLDFVEKNKVERISKGTLTDFTSTFTTHLKRKRGKVQLYKLDYSTLNNLSSSS